MSAYQQCSFSSSEGGAIAYRTEQNIRHKGTLELGQKDEENDPCKDL